LFRFRSVCFASKQNEINVFSLLFTILGRYRHIKVRDQPSYFSLILYKLSQNFTLSFFALKFLLLFRFVFASFHFLHRSEKNLLPFRFKAKMMAVFRFRFASFRFEAERMAVFCFLFSSFRFEAKMMTVFCFFSFCFCFVPFSFRFRFLRFASMRNKRKKHFFFASKRKKFRFRFASFRFEAKMTAHPNQRLGVSQEASILLGRQTAE
jgi:hypothetical protein